MRREMQVIISPGLIEAYSDVEKSFYVLIFRL